MRTELFLGFFTSGRLNRDHRNDFIKVPNNLHLLVWTTEHLSSIFLLTLFKIKNHHRSSSLWKRARLTYCWWNCGEARRLPLASAFANGEDFSTVLRRNVSASTVGGNCRSLRRGQQIKGHYCEVRRSIFEQPKKWNSWSRVKTIQSIIYIVITRLFLHLGWIFTVAKFLRAYARTFYARK